MAFQHEDVIAAQALNLENERVQALAEYEAGRVNNDNYGCMAAANRILEIDAKRDALDRIASNYLAGQQRQQSQQSNRFGLSNDELAVAENSHSSGTRDQRIEQYARNKQRLQHMRATGAYRDDQGTVRR